MSRAGRKGSRKQSPPRPDDIAWHCSMVSKLQEVTAEVTSLRQYSPALAGVAKAKYPRANNAVAGAAVILKNCFISFSLFLLSVLAISVLWSAFQPREPEMGCRASARHLRMADALSRLLFVVEPLRS